MFSKKSIAAGVLAAAFVPGAAAAAETYGMKNASHPEKGVLAAGQPTGEQIQLAAEDGYRTVIDLRAAGEPRGFDEAQAAKDNGLAYVNIPVASLDQAVIDQFLAALKTAERPVLVHCGTSNRVGALWYAHLVLEKGLTEKAAMEQAKAAGLTSAELEQKITALVAERKAKP
jgi:uncharacterized protein (TIGR01244 family)